MFNYDQKQTFVSIISHCPPSKSRSTSIWNLSYVSPSPFFEISVTSCYAEWCLRWVLISYVLTSMDRFGTHTASHYQRRDGASSIDHTDLPPCFDFSTTYCTHISCSQLCVSPMSWWWYTFICTKDSVKNIHCQIEYIGTGMGIGKINRASWMQKKGVLPKHWRNQPRQLISPMQKKGVLPLLGMSMSQEHHRSKGRDQRKQGVVFL